MLAIGAHNLRPLTLVGGNVKSPTIIPQTRVGSFRARLALAAIALSEM
jgi:hypothetical protein